MDCYAVMGNPIAHTQSPVIHQLFAKQTGQQLLYKPILVELNELEAALNRFQLQQGCGLNITSPFKQEAFALVGLARERAARAKAVNTIGFNNDGTCWGDNTDGVGLVRDLIFNRQITIRGKRLLILGAGGAVRGILEAILAEHPSQLIIANRTANKAKMLAEEFADLGPIQACQLSELENFVFDVVINGVSTSLQTTSLELPVSIVSSASYCYDMVYGKGMTPFLSWSKKQGASYCDGIGMLIEQAAESFYLWRGIKPDTQPVLTRFS